MNSRAKGVRGERLWRDVLREHGYMSARRGMQFSGSPDSPDVVCPELKDWFFEVKCVQALNVSQAFDKAKQDAGTKVPVLAHKKDHQPWLVTISADTFFAMLEDAMVPNE